MFIHSFLDLFKRFSFFTEERNSKNTQNLQLGRSGAAGGGRGKGNSAGERDWFIEPETIGSIEIFSD